MPLKLSSRQPFRFKSRLSLVTKSQKAEFAQDVIGLANTKSSGKRYLIAGFDDKTKKYSAPPDKEITQDKIEAILSDLTDPVVTVCYKVVDYRLGKFGKLTVIRKSSDLPYKAAKDVYIDEKRNLGLKKGKIYVRHGSHTELPTDTELERLIDEGERVRN